MNEQEIEIKMLRLKGQVYDQSEYIQQMQGVVRTTIMTLAEALGASAEDNSLEQLLSMVKERL